jgi:hypothetical protein
MLPDGKEGGVPWLFYLNSLVFIMLRFDINPASILVQVSANNAITIESRKIINGLLLKLYQNNICQA